MNKNPVAFMSYVRTNDAHDNGRLTQFRERLAGEIQMQSGEDFHIFQDRDDIAWGEKWQERIDGSLDAVTFLIPIITPAFFRRPACRQELERFLDRERRLGRDDLVLPVYYVSCPLLDEEDKRRGDALAVAVASRQRADWRDLRFEPFTAPEVGKRLAQMARQIMQALERGQPASLLPPASGAASAAQPVAAQPARQPSEAPQAVPESSQASVPSRRNEPHIRVVDALRQGDHATLTEALQAAQPGDRILVRPGTYCEGIVVDKVVEIVGDGEVNDIVIEATGKDAILFKATMGRIVNLTLRQIGGGKFYAVDIAQGRVDIEDCDITSQTHAAVAIHHGADPRLRRNRIHDSKQSGVYVYENGQGTIEDNDIFANALSGVAIATGSSPMLRRNRIHDSRQSGVYVYKNGQGTIEDNDIFANALPGVAIRTGGSPTLRRNRIHDGKEGGVMVYENGQGTIEDNDIFANALSGVEIKKGGSPTVRRNRIHDGKQSGVYVHENGQGTIEDNDIFANASAGVAIREGGSPTLRRNRITKNGYEAIWIYDGGKGIVEGNDLRGNKRGAWDLAAECAAQVTRANNLE
jgi:parallel beta-helix repeat protein